MKKAFTYLGIDIFISSIPVSKTHWLLHQNEFWKDVPEWELSYQISSLGRLKSKDRMVTRGSGLMKIKGRLFRYVIDNGYKRVSLSGYGKSRKEYIHRIICFAFIPNPDSKPEVNHKNGIKLDSRLMNLEWVTKTENLQHSYDTGLHPPKGPGLISGDNLRKFKSMFKDKKTAKEISEYFGLDLSSVYKLRKRYGIPKASFASRSLTDCQVREIRKMHENKRHGYSHTANKFGVIPEVVSQIIRMKSYKDVE